MLSYLSAVWAWLTESANLLLDLANAGRATDNAFAIAIAATLAIIRLSALLIFTLPALGWLKSQIWLTKERRHRDEWVEETTLRAFIIVLIIASIAFEFWVSPERKAATDAGNAPPIEAGDTP